MFRSTTGIFILKRLRPKFDLCGKCEGVVLKTDGTSLFVHHNDGKRVDEYVFDNADQATEYLWRVREDMYVEAEK